MTHLRGQENEGRVLLSRRGFVAGLLVWNVSSSLFPFALSAQDKELSSERLVSLGLNDFQEKVVRQQTLEIPRSLIPDHQKSQPAAGNGKQHSSSSPSGRRFPKKKKTPVKYLVRGNSSSAMHRKALNSLPLNRLTARDRQRVQKLLASHCLFRRLPTLQFPADQQAYHYFATHPDVAVSIWHALNISEFQLQAVSPGVYSARSVDGSSGFIEMLYQTPQEHLVLCSGQYKSPLLIRPIKASALFHLRASFAQPADGVRSVTHYADVFVAFPAVAVETVARIIAPIGYIIADRNFYELSLFVYVMSRTMETHPGWIEELAERMQGVSQADKAEFLALARKVRQRSQKEANRSSANVARLEPTGSEKTREILPSESQGLRPAPIQQTSSEQATADTAVRR